MLKIRLQRVGRKHEPSFRFVLTDSKNSTKSGRFKEVLGSYDPRKETDLLKTDRIKHWLGLGAKPTGTVHNLLVTHGVLSGKKVNVLPKKKPIVKEATVEETPAPAPVAEAPVEAAPVTADGGTPQDAVEPAPVETPAEESTPAAEKPEEVVQ